METFRTNGTCARQIIYDVKDNCLVSCKFVHGCSGNNQGIARLAIGQNIDELIAKLKGIQCKHGTSCPDQLARALTAYKDKLAAIKLQQEKAAALAAAAAAEAQNTPQ